MRLTRLDRQALEIDERFRFPCNLPLFVIRMDAVQEILPAFAGLNVFNTDIDTLRNNALADTLVHNNTESMWCYIVHLPGFTVITLMGHAFLNTTIALNINDITPLVHTQVHVGWERSMVAEGTREKVASTTSITFRIGHGALCFSSNPQNVPM